jgi:hypothetical protein
MGRSWRVRWLLLVAIGLVATLGQMPLAEGQVPTSSVGTTIEQCKNGTSGVGDCTGSAWITGNLNGQKALYSEGDFVPFRTIITGLTNGTDYTLRIGYDAVEDGLHAYDYLGSYDASEAPGQQIVPCDGVAGTLGPHRCGIGVPGPPSTLAVPTDADTSMPSGGQRPGLFSAWGGRLTTAAYVAPTPIDVTTTGTVEREIDVTFTAEGNTVVLAWGGHLASNLDWGAGETFLGNHSGSSFHMRLHSINGASTGHQDLSINADVVAPAPSSFTTLVRPSTVAVGDSVTDVAVLSGPSGVPAGSVAFFVCFDAATPPDCTKGGVPAAQSPIVVSRRRRGQPRFRNTGLASAQFVPDTPGFHCFRAEYTPAAGVPYSPTSHTDPATECFQATVPTMLSVIKICDPTDDDGHFNLLMDGALALADATCGSGTGPQTVSAGRHTVGETAGTGTSLGDYVTTIGGDCSTNGSITLAPGQSGSCTITNARKTPSVPTATLTVNKVCEPASDTGRFDLYIDAMRFPDVTCGDGTGPVTLPVGTYTVSEQAGSDTQLDDYTTVIGGDCADDGSVTLAADESKTCTITNTRVAVPTTTLTVDKECLPADDPGHFDLMIDGETAGTGADVGCGGTTGEVKVDPGLHTVDESGEGGTDLGDYTTFVGGDCTANGVALLAEGDHQTCTIMNVRLGQPFALLTVNKICVPDSDDGLFDLSIDRHDATDQPCGGGLGPIAVTVGKHQVGETAGTDTNLADYTASIGGDCASDGSITLAAGQSAICSITNVRKAPTPTPTPTATIAVKKICVPATNPRRFTLRLDQQLLPAMACGQGTGPMTVATGIHTVVELRVRTDPANFKTVIGGDCAANGTITLAAGEHGTCTVTNTAVRPVGPERPPTICNRVTVTPTTLIVGRTSRIRVRVKGGGRGVLGARVTLTGDHVFRRRFTRENGTVRILVRPTRAGIVTVATQRQFGCHKPPRDPLTAVTLKPKRPAVTG